MLMRTHERNPIVKSRHVAIGAVAVGAFACGALAVGAIAIGALAINRLAIRRGRVQSLEIGDLRVRNLQVVHGAMLERTPPAGRLPGPAAGIPAAGNGTLR